MGNDRDDATYNPLIVPQHFHRSSNFFICKAHYGYCERPASSDRNMIEAHICTIRNRILHYGSSTIITRQEIPNIIPPLPTTGCDDLEDGSAKSDCEVDIKNIIRIAACMGAGLVIVSALFFIARTLARWIRVVRPRKETILIGKEAKKKAAGRTGRGMWIPGGRQMQELFLGRQALINEGNAELRY